MEEQDRRKPMTETAILAAVDTGEYDADSSLDELEEPVSYTHLLSGAATPCTKRLSMWR